MKRKRRTSISTTVIYIVLTVAVIFTLFPLAWLFLTSVKYPRDYYSKPPIWIPSKITSNHYKVLFSSDYNAGPYIINTIVIAFSNTMLVLVIGILAAYSIARYSIGGKKLEFWILMQRMLPPVALVIPLFILYSRLRIVDTYIGLILCYTVHNLAFAVWMLIGFFRETPPELYEAAMLDGCNQLQVILKVILPIIIPSVVVVGLFCLVYAWNDLMFAVTFSRQNTKTLMILITTTMQSPEGIYFGEAAGAAMIGLIPPFILTFVFQRYLVRGLSYGAVKG